eukprot:Platyproteum_vivax@DN5171_c0_g1_i1.p1
MRLLIWIVVAFVASASPELRDCKKLTPTQVLEIDKKQLKPNHITFRVSGEENVVALDKILELRDEKEMSVEAYAADQSVVFTLVEYVGEFDYGHVWGVELSNGVQLLMIVQITGLDSFCYRHAQMMCLETFRQNTEQETLQKNLFYTVLGLNSIVQVYGGGYIASPPLAAFWLIPWGIYKIPFFINFYKKAHFEVSVGLAFLAAGAVADDAGLNLSTITNDHILMLKAGVPLLMPMLHLGPVEKEESTKNISQLQLMNLVAIANVCLDAFPPVDRTPLLDSEKPPSAKLVQFCSGMSSERVPKTNSSSLFRQMVCTNMVDPIAKYTTDPQGTQPLAGIAREIKTSYTYSSLLKNGLKVTKEHQKFGYEDSEDNCFPIKAWWPADAGKADLKLVVNHINEGSSHSCEAAPSSLEPPSQDGPRKKQAVKAVELKPLATEKWLVADPTKVTELKPPVFPSNKKTVEPTRPKLSRSNALEPDSTEWGSGDENLVTKEQLAASQFKLKTTLKNEMNKEMSAKLTEEMERLYKRMHEEAEFSDRATNVIIDQKVEEHAKNLEADLKAKMPRMSEAEHFKLTEEAVAKVLREHAITDKKIEMKIEDDKKKAEVLASEEAANKSAQVERKRLEGMGEKPPLNLGDTFLRDQHAYGRYQQGSQAHRALLCFVFVVLADLMM